VPYDVYEVEALAGRENISIRTGCFCNPGDGEVAHEITAEEMERCFASGRRAGQPVTLRDCQALIADASGKVPNTIRVSLGIASDFSDVWRFAAFAERFIDIEAGAMPSAS
jgi:selenocysteine lyase/cysteine desulfurase